MSDYEEDMNMDDLPDDDDDYMDDGSGDEAQGKGKASPGGSPKEDRRKKNMFGRDKPKKGYFGRPADYVAKGPQKHGKKEKKTKFREEDRKYHKYISKVFKTIHPDMQIHPETVGVVNTCIYDLLEQVCEEAAKMIARNNKKTMSSSDIQFAIRALFPKELAKHAEMEGIQAVARAEGMQTDQPGP